ncbi:MAG TPA: LCP family protein [Candidatus Limnocylindrales bacterium]|nr:LCP family protein [Candidatus Limnocylindrales bacterium]
MRTATRTELHRRTHARRPPPGDGSADPGRLIAAALSGLLPGLGQAFNRRRTPATWLLLLSLAALTLAWLVLTLIPPSRLIAWVVAPSNLRALLVINVAILTVRLVAVGHAFRDRRFTARPGRGGLVGLAVIVVFVAVPHALLASYGLAAEDAFGRIFVRPRPNEPAPSLDARLTVLLIGVDSAPWRTTTLTDALIVVSVDPVGKTATMLSLPRDLVDVPLGNGDTYGPKINSLLSYAEGHSEAFPDGGTKALQRAIASLLGIDIDYTATLDFFGFQRMVDILGGVTIDNHKAIDDDNYDMYDGRGRGFQLSKGIHTLDGPDALAYVRSRFTPGDTDFDRARRQQQVLVALRDRFLSFGGVLQLPALLDALGGSVRTDLPTALLPDLAALVEEIDRDSVVGIVVRSPLVRSGGRNHPYGSVQVPDVDLIREVSALAFGPPGAPPRPWPTPVPSATPGRSASP